MAQQLEQMESERESLKNAIDILVATESVDCQTLEKYKEQFMDISDKMSEIYRRFNTPHEEFRKDTDEV
jgi:chromosome segregation ATPase